MSTSCPCATYESRESSLQAGHEEMVKYVWKGDRGEVYNT